MSTAPIVYKTTHRIKFAELDPYQHMATVHYGGYFLEHRMCGLRDNVGWDLKTLGTLPFAIWIKRMEIDFLRPAVGDQEITITSFVREFHGSEAHIEISMVDSAGMSVSRCFMIAACIDKKTNRPMDWAADIMTMFFEKGTA
ncbi:MAG: acyl-CoA thioesterase [Gemmatimonadaceae bacterium]